MMRQCTADHMEQCAWRSEVRPVQHYLNFMTNEKHLARTYCHLDLPSNQRSMWEKKFNPPAGLVYNLPSSPKSFFQSQL